MSMHVNVGYRLTHMPHISEIQKFTLLPCPMQIVPPCFRAERIIDTLRLVEVAEALRSDTLEHGRSRNVTNLGACLPLG